MKNPWVKFGKGHWTRTPPTEPGEYPVRDRDGLGDYQRLVVLKGKDGKLSIVGPSISYEDTDYWQGWWWSEPYPKLPKCPDGRSEDEK